MHMLVHMIYICNKDLSVGGEIPRRVVLNPPVLLGKSGINGVFHAYVIKQGSRRCPRDQANSTIEPVHGVQQWNRNCQFRCQLEFYRLSGMFLSLLCLALLLVGQFVGTDSFTCVRT